MGKKVIIALQQPSSFPQGNWEYAGVYKGHDIKATIEHICKKMRRIEPDILFKTDNATIIAFKTGEEHTTTIDLYKEEEVEEVNDKKLHTAWLSA